MSVDGPRFPSTLVVSTTRLGQMTATGAAMLSLFGDWPTDRLFQLHTDKAKGSNEGSQYPEFYIEGEPAKPGLGGLWKSYRRQADRGLFDRIASWAAEQRPEVIYYRAIDKPRYMWWLPIELSQRLGVPLVTHIMDDWPKRMTDVARSEGRHRDAEAIHEELHRLFARTSRALSICDKMSKAFGERYGVSFQAFQNSIDAAEWEGVTRARSVDTDGVFRLVYAGSLAEDMTLQSFIELTEAVGLLRDRGLPVQLNIYGARWWQKVFDKHVGKKPGIRYVGFVPRERYVQSLVDADLLVMPINFDDRSLTYIRYSLANKGPDYMAAGAPILVYGSPEAATVEYAIKHKWAEVISSQGVDKLADTIAGLMSDAERRAQLAQQAAKVGAAFHNALKNRERFRKLMCDVATGVLV